MKQFVLDANKVIMASDETTDKVDEVMFEPNEVYTVDIALTKGDGKTRSVGLRPTVYRRNVEENYNLKMKCARAVLSEVDARYPVFPFSCKWACEACVRRRSLEEKNYRMGLVECVNHYLLDEYPVINTYKGEVAVHYKFTVLLVPNGTDRISGEVIDAAAYPSEKKCEDEAICAIMKEPAMKKKSKKSKAKKAAAKKAQE